MEPRVSCGRSASDVGIAKLKTDVTHGRSALWIPLHTFWGSVISTASKYRGLKNFSKTKLVLNQSASRQVLQRRLLDLIFSHEPHKIIVRCVQGGGVGLLVIPHAVAALMVWRTQP